MHQVRWLCRRQLVRPVLLLASFALRMSFAESPAKYTVIENVEYSHEPITLHLDAHIPDGKGPVPAVILVHGGGWTAGNKTANFVLPLFDPLNQTGYSWFTVDYRLAPQYPYPAAVEDVEAAILFVKMHAREYKVDTSKIALMGESAGGHLVNLVGARNKPPADVAAVVSFYGPIDMLKWSERLQRKPPSGGVKDFYAISAWDPEALSKLRDSSPSTWLGRQTPPFLFIQGTADTAVPYEQATIAAQLFRDKNIPYRLITVQDGVHGVINWEKDPKFQGYKTEMIAWLQKTLGQPEQ